MPAFFLAQLPRHAGERVEWFIAQRPHGTGLNLENNQRTRKVGMKLNAVLLSAALAAVSVTAVAADAPYKVTDGNKVDEKTLQGWRTWRAAACERCHGPNQEGMVGPSLVEALKTMSKQDFNNVVLKGRPEKGMPNFDGSKQVSENIDNLYAYLKGRSDGAIKPGRVEALPQ
jgi:mono/diheme cytochrome c family protein